MSIHVTCGECGVALKIKEDRAGTKGRCPKCKAEFLVPAAGEASASDESALVKAVPASASGMAVPATDEAVATPHHKLASVADDDDLDSAPRLSQIPDEDEAPQMAAPPATAKRDVEAAPQKERAVALAADTVSEDLLLPPPADDSDTQIHTLDDEPAAPDEEDFPQAAAVAARSPALQTEREPANAVDGNRKSASPPEKNGRGSDKKNNRRSRDDDDFDPMEVLGDTPAAKSKPRSPKPVIPSTVDDDDEMLMLGDDDAEQAMTAKTPFQPPAPPKSSPSRAVKGEPEPWDHAKAAKQMMKAIRDTRDQEPETTRKDQTSQIDYAGLFQEFGVKGLGGLAAVLVFAYCAYLVVNSAMGSKVKLPPLAAVSGTVTLDGKPLSGATVFFAPMAEAAGDSKKQVRPRTSIGLTDDEGRFTMRYLDNYMGVAVGRCRVWIEMRGPDGRSQVPPDHTEGAMNMKDIAAGQRQTFDFAMKSPPSRR